MADIKIGSLVKIKSLQNTVANCGYDDKLLPIGSVAKVSDKFKDMVELNSDETLSYHTTDLEVMNKQLLSDVEDPYQYEGAEVTLIDRLLLDLDKDPISGDTFTLENVFKESSAYSVDWCEVYNDDDTYFNVSLDEVYVDILEEVEAEEENIELSAADPSPVSFTITEDDITLIYNGRVDNITSDAPNFEDVLQNIIVKDYETAQSLMNPASAILNWGQGLLDITDGKVVYNGMDISNKLTTRILDMMGNGDDSFERFAKCLTLTMENPSFKNRERIMDFVSADDIEIDQDGYIICYKNVRDDYTDKHTGKFSYKVGESPSMPRTEVDDRDENTCSHGLHAASAHYLKNGWNTNGKNLRVKVDPRDVVSIPVDYKDSKMRTCKMTVIEDITGRESEFGF